MTAQHESRWADPSWNFRWTVPAGFAHLFADAIMRTIRPVAEALVEHTDDDELNESAALGAMEQLDALHDLYRQAASEGFSAVDIEIRAPLVYLGPVAVNGICFHRRWIADTEPEFTYDLDAHSRALMTFIQLHDDVLEVAAAFRRHYEKVARRGQLRIVARDEQAGDAT